MGDKSNDGDISMEDIEDDIMHADDSAVEMTLYTFGNVVRLIGGKKRGEFLYGRRSTRSTHFLRRTIQKSKYPS